MNGIALPDLSSGMRRVGLTIAAACGASVAVLVLIAWVDDPRAFAADPVEAILRPFRDRTIVCGKSGRAEADLQNLSTQLMLFEVVSGRLPTNEEGLSALVVRPADVRSWRPIMESVPLDPWNRAYGYRSPGTGSTDKFEIYSLGPDGVVSGDDIGTW